MKKFFLHTILGLGIVAVLSCAKEVSQEQLIQEAIEIKLRQWKESQIIACKEKALMQADDYVDSLLLVTSLQSKLDTIPKSAKPFKPPKPLFKEKPDNVTVVPIYKKE
jgi:hypothetical protein